MQSFGISRADARIIEARSQGVWRADCRSIELAGGRGAAMTILVEDGSHCRQGLS
jgi:hypothetical protein